MAFITAEARQAGKDGEAAFQQWLDASLVPYTYLQQNVASFPKRLRGAIKRPDYLIGFPSIGSMAFDVKNHRLHDGHFALQEEEVKKYGNFEWFFNIRVLYAFWQPESQFTQCALLFNEEFARAPTVKKRFGLCREVPPQDNDFYDVRKTSFSEAINQQLQITDQPTFIAR